MPLVVEDSDPRTAGDDNMVQRMTVSAFLLLLALQFTACDFRGRSIDEGNLELVVAQYYRPGDKKNLDPAVMYKFFSAKSREQVTEDEWAKTIKGFSDGNAYTAITILANREEKGHKYAVVSVAVDARGKEGDTEKRIYSNTWMLESGKWRRLAFPKIEEETSAVFFGGDFAAAKKKAEEWLSLDPFSVTALAMLGESIKGSPPQIFKGSDRSVDDILRVMLAINPKDTTVLFYAATWAKDISVAKTFLRKMEGLAGYDGAAANVAYHIGDPQKRIRFLSELPEDGKGIRTAKLLSLYDLRLWDDFRKAYGNEGTFEFLTAFFDDDTTAVAANRAGELGAACFFSGNTGEAQRWLEYGISKDPNDYEVQKLARLVN